MDLLKLYSIPFWQVIFPDFETEKDDILKRIKYLKENQDSDGLDHNTNNFCVKNLQQDPTFFNSYQFICEFGGKCAEDIGFEFCDVAMSNSYLAVNNKRESMLSEHVDDFVFSGYYFIKVPENSGKVCVKNPVINQLWDGMSLVQRKNEFTSKLIKITPQEGSIILFPSYVPSSVETNTHDDEFIFVRFTLSVTKQGVFDKLNLQPTADSLKYDVDKENSNDETINPEISIEGVVDENGKPLEIVDIKLLQPGDPGYVDLNNYVPDPKYLDEPEKLNEVE